MNKSEVVVTHQDIICLVDRLSERVQQRFKAVLLLE